MSCDAVIAVRPMTDDGVDSENAVPAEDDEQEGGARCTKKVANPRLPRKDDIEEHEKTHLPFRNWCRHCVRGKGKEMAHMKVEQEVTIPEFHMDFGFFGDEGDPGKTLPVLVVRERCQGW